MNSIELLDIVSSGETSCVQFKEKMDNDESIAAEMIAMSNSKGGKIIFGVKDKIGEIAGLNYKELRCYGSRLTDIAYNKVIPRISFNTEIVSINHAKVLVVCVEQGTNKPYKDSKSAIWIKQEADKRRVVDNNEIKRLFQESSGLSADEMAVNETSMDNIDERLFAECFKREFGHAYQKGGLTFEKALEVKKVIRDGRATLAGLLFFGKDPQRKKPAFTVKAVSFAGNDLSGKRYRSKPPDFIGTIPDLFKQALDFCSANLQHMQEKENEFNTIGKLEVSRTALEELIQNALIHRDCFKNSPVRLHIFDNRIEIISPGRLPNSLTVEEIKYGNPVIRNNQMAAFASHLMPYSGLGSGIKRALQEQGNIEFTNDTAGEQFIVKIPRPEKQR
jgi:predicted HTH transcriptional regulator